jgi:hypothetical protein
MISLTPRARQCDHSPWTHERLEKERAIAIGALIDTSSAASYSSALNSYITFCRIHKFPIEPTLDTFSFYIVFMCHHIKPKSVDSYLSGICNQLEPFFPKVHEIRQHHLVTKTLQGCKKLCGCATSHKQPLTHLELGSLAPHYTVPGTNHNDLLFFSILLTGFHRLLRLGELTWPD